MGKSQTTFNKKEKEKKRLKKKKEKQERKEERRANSVGGALENMMAYVDEFGNITDTPPDPDAKKKEVKAESIELGIPKKDPSDDIKRGRVDYYNDEKGYGFILGLGGSDKYFFHVDNTEGPVGVRDIVTFTFERGPKGLVALNVKKQ